MSVSYPVVWKTVFECNSWKWSKKLVLFMDKKEQKVFTDNYTRLISENNWRSAGCLSDTEKENVYELKDVDSATRDTIKESLRKAETTCHGAGAEVLPRPKRKILIQQLSDEQKRWWSCYPVCRKEWTSSPFWNHAIKAADGYETGNE